MIAYVTFGSSGKHYAYFTGRLNISDGDWVIVPVGKDNELKIVRVIGISSHDPFAKKLIWGRIERQEQDK